MTESDLVQAARSGSREAIRQLYDRYAPRVFAVVRRIAGDDAAAEDCAQEAWLRALRALPAFRGDARFSTWLHRIAVNAALEGARRSQTTWSRESALVPALEARTQDRDPLLARNLESALGALPPGMRQVIILHDVERYTHEEIADALGVTVGTSKSQLFKARARMREWLRLEEGHPARPSTPRSRLGSPERRYGGMEG